MLRLHSGCTPDVIGGYIGGKMIQSLQCTQDVPTGFQDTSPPVSGLKLSSMPSTPRTAHRLPPSKAKPPTKHSGARSPISAIFAFLVLSAMCTTTLLRSENSTRAHSPLSSSATPPLQKHGDTTFHRDASRERRETSFSTNVHGARSLIIILRGS